MSLQMELGNNRMLKDIIVLHRFELLALLLLSLLGTVFSLATPYIMGLLIDTVLVGKDPSMLVPILLMMTCLFLTSALSNYISTILRGNLDLVLFREMTSDLFGVIHESSYKDLQQIKTGDLLTRTTGNTHVAVQTITSLIPGIAVMVFSIIVPFFVMFSLNPKLAVIASCPVFLFVICSVYYGNKIRKGQRNSLDAAAGINSFLKEAYSIVPLTKVFLLEQWMRNKFDARMSRYYDTTYDVVRLSSMSSSMGMVIYGIPTLVVLTFGSMEVLAGSMTLGVFTAFIGYTTLFFSPIQVLSLLWTSYKGSLASFDRIQETFSLRRESWGEATLSSRVKTIQLKNISFSYGARVIFHNFSATFTLGRNYLTGENGSGKTTLINLLSGLYRPESGEILFDGKPITTLDRTSLRSSVSVVFSDSLVFDGTIYENILIGNTSASPEDIIAAAKKVELDSFIQKLPAQYDTEVGESGLALSSGEKQKIALARVILRDSPVIIFDEFTRSIDAESKQSILSVLRKMEDKIIIIITHDRQDIDPGCPVTGIKKNRELHHLIDNPGKTMYTGGTENHPMPS